MSTHCDRYVYSNYYKVIELNDWEYNPRNPLDYVKIIEESNIEEINLYGAVYGIHQIMKDYNITLEYLGNLPPPLETKHPYLSEKSHNILKEVQNIPRNYENDCDLSIDYASGPDLTLKCEIIVKHLNIYKTETLHSKAPVVKIIHDFYESESLEKWSKKIEIMETYHMKSLYESTIHDNVKEEFINLLSYKREGAIGFVPNHDSPYAVQNEKYLKTLLEVVDMLPMKNVLHFETYQFGIYGIGGFIEDHLDTYGKVDSPMEKILGDLSGKSRNLLRKPGELYLVICLILANYAKWSRMRPYCSESPKYNFVND